MLLLIAESKFYFSQFVTQKSPLIAHGVIISQSIYNQLFLISLLIISFEQYRPGWIILHGCEVIMSPLTKNASAIVV